ncbi:MAG: YeeE/YedE family protein [Gammaproteobacteria bacterium]|nr:YeeE/YedE family protein [Gammaproteobacteria bacterium]
MKWLTVFISGLLFALGLGIAGMTQPEKIINFLDISGGHWDPSMLFVMGGAVGVNMMLYRLIIRRRHPVFEAAFTMPRRRLISRRLVTGAGLFGAGWGLAGYCPGPGLVASFSGSLAALSFVIAMLVGMQLYQLLQSLHQDDDVDADNADTAPRN